MRRSYCGSHTHQHYVLEDTTITQTITLTICILQHLNFCNTAVASVEFYYEHCINDTICYTQQRGRHDKILKCIPSVMCDLNECLKLDFVFPALPNSFGSRWNSTVIKIHLAGIHRETEKLSLTATATLKAAEFLMVYFQSVWEIFVLRFCHVFE